MKAENGFYLTKINKIYRKELLINDSNEKSNMQLNVAQQRNNRTSHLKSAEASAI